MKLIRKQILGAESPPPPQIMNSAGGWALGAESAPCLLGEGRGRLHRGVPQPLGEAGVGGAEPAGGSAQPPGSLLPGSINLPPRSHSQRQSQRAAHCSHGAPRAEDLCSGAQGTTAPQECQPCSSRAAQSVRAGDPVRRQAPRRGAPHC